MSQRETTLWCPTCQRSSRHAPLPQLADDEQLIAQLATTADARGFFRRHYCLDCRSIWQSVELPVEFVEQLLTSRVACEELRREIARLRFLLAQQRQCGTLLNRAA